jgi:hypothetical protein
MRRLFWLALGATVGALLVRRLTKAAQSLTPKVLAASVSGSVSGLAEALRDFAAEVRDGMSVREAELLEGAGIDGHLGARPEEF